MSQHNVAPAKPSFYCCSMKFFIRSEQHWFLQMQNLMKELRNLRHLPGSLKLRHSKQDRGLLLLRTCSCGRP